MVVKPLSTAPTRWYTAGFPPLRSLRLFPNTPDQDIALELKNQPGKPILDPTAYEPEVWMPSQADQVTRLLDAHFGTPASPTVRIPAWDDVVTTAIVRLDPEKGLGANLKAARTALGKWPWDDWRADWNTANSVNAELKLDDATLARGSLVYRRWCMQCHGPSGAGDPAHAIEGGPMPRDYRLGVFKFITAFPPSDLKKKGLGASGKPRRDDLKRTVRNGLDGSIMPAFSSLTEQELEDVVSYVIHLSIRGETEFATLAKGVSPGDEDPIFVGGELDWLFMQNELFVLINWGIAAKNPIPIAPENTPTEADRRKSAVRGYKLYHSTAFGCSSCHGDYGRQRQLKWDKWATIAQPRNLTLGVYRGGRKGEDLYARLYGGIEASGMNPFHPQLAGSTPGQPDKLWDLVHFLQALPDPNQRRRMQELDREVKFE